MNHAAHCPTFRLDYAQLSDLGMRRPNNQDSMAAVVTENEATWSQRGHLMMIADGMGAHAAGELASKLAVDNIPHTYYKLRDLYPPAALRQAIREANALVHQKGQSAIGFQGMGTTCSCLVLLPQGALVAHIGDSRVYRLREHQLEQLTFDHSLVWEMAAAGHMAEEDVPAFIPKNVITRSLGPHETVNIDLEGPYDVAAGDVFLLCSDGLSGQLSDLEIGVLLHCLTPHEAVQTLVDLANLRGGPDNISVIVAKVGVDGDPSSVDSTRGAGGSAAPSRNSTLLRIASVACLFAVAFCLVNTFWVAAAIAAAGLATTIGMLVAGRNGRRASGAIATSIGGPYGNGPYRATKCKPNQEIVDGLREIAERLRRLKDDTALKVDWSLLDELVGEGRSTADTLPIGHYCTIIRQYSDAIRQTMAQIRDQNRTVDDGTAESAS
jgi:protein phosphatase